MRTPLWSLSLRSKTGRCTANRSGFTLIELLVVVAIIAVLAVVGVVVFANAQVSARDARRRADLDALSKALEANFSQTTSTYSLGSSMFTANKVPVESKTGHPAYCLYSSTIRSNPPTDFVTTVPSTTGWTSTACPNILTTTGTYLTPTTSLPSGTDVIVWWKLCMVLESGNTVICKNNTQ